MLHAILQGDCLAVIPRLPSTHFDGVITSPPYNFGGDPNHGKGELYGAYGDDLTRDDWLGMIGELFRGLDRVVKPNGTVCLVVSYSSKDAILPYDMVTYIHSMWKWTLVETIAWVKNSSTPLNTSPRNLSRRMELVLVFARKTETDTFVTNKAKGVVTNGQQFYRYTPNVIEARNRDRHPNIKHSATFSKELVKKLMDIYYPKGSVVLDPFVGVGTTVVSAMEQGRQAVGIEVDSGYVEYGREWVDRVKRQGRLDGW